MALEFIHRVIDVLEEFLGAPLLASKIESSYDVVAQLLNEMCDAGTIATTEGNALRDLVEVEGFMGKLLGGLSLSRFVARASASTPHKLTIMQQFHVSELRHTNASHIIHGRPQCTSTTLAAGKRKAHITTLIC